MSLRTWAGLLGLYAIVALGLLAPMASNEFLPNTLDLPPHVAATVQARLALEEGQWPLRVAPWQHAGRRNALFQFYGQLPYTLTGLLHASLLRANPYLALKLLAFAALLLAGCSTFALARYLGAAPAAALLSGLAYMAAPYPLDNLHMRGAIVEVAGQGLVPLVLLMVLRALARGGASRLGQAAAALAALFLTHLITFVYSVLACAALALVAACAGPGARRRRRLLRAGLVSCGFLALCAYQLLPLLQARGYLPIAVERPDVQRFAWLTPLSSLLQPGAVPPVPQGSMWWQGPYVSPAVGMPALAGVLLYLAVRFFGLSVVRPQALRRSADALFGVWLAGLIAAWSPFDFWRLLPSPLSVAQFPYRLLTVPAWSGALLLGLALTAVLTRSSVAPATLVCGLLVLGAAAPRLHVSQALGVVPGKPMLAREAPPPSVRDALPNLVRYPDLGYPAWAYNARLYGDIADDRHLLVWLPPGKELGGDRFWMRGFLRRASSRPLHLHALPRDGGAASGKLRLVVGGSSVAELDLASASPEGAPLAASVASAAPDARATLIWEGETGASATPGPAAVLAPAGWKARPIYAPPGLDPAFKPTDAPSRHGDRVIVSTALDEDALLVLPAEYYPGLMDVRLDGRRVPSWGLARESDVLTGVDLPAGRHVVSVRFEGSRIGNVVSLAAVAGLLSLVAVLRTRRALRRRASQGRTTPAA